MLILSSILLLRSSFVSSSSFELFDFKAVDFEGKVLDGACIRYLLLLLTELCSDGRGYFQLVCELIRPNPFITVGTVAKVSNTIKQAQ